MNYRGTQMQGRANRKGLIAVLLCSTIGFGEAALAQIDEAQPFAT